MFNKIECETCNGWGWLNSDITQTCPKCKGLGTMHKPLKTVFKELVA